MNHTIEAAKSGRSTCVTCGENIAKGEVRVGELYQDSRIGPQRFESYYRGGDRFVGRSEGREAIRRYHHLACAVAKHPTVVKSALDAPHDASLIDDPVQLRRDVDASLEAERQARVAAATARMGADAELETDPDLEPMLAQLADAPDDLDLLAVAGDLFQSLGDPRGELIAIQLATRELKRERGPEIAGVRGARSRPTRRETSTTPAMIQRRDDLLAELSPRLDSGDRSVWGLGFVRRLELGPKSGGRLLELAGLWSHPSIRLLVELRVEMPLRTDDTAVLAQLAKLAPKSLRKLEIGGNPQGTGALAALVAALPRLESLALLSRRAEAISHPRLTRIAVHGEHYGDNLAILDPAQLPAVREIAIREWARNTEPLAALARTPWVEVIDRIELGESASNGIDTPVPLSMEDAVALRARLAGRKLARLEITGVPIPLPVRAVLTETCTELVCPSGAVVLDADTTHVEHANKPEWGRGKIVKRRDGKLEIEFPKLGRKVFKADAPFLIPVGRE